HGVGGLAVGVDQGQADAGGDIGRFAVDGKRAVADGEPRLFGHVHGVAGGIADLGVQAVEQHDEFVGADARHQIAVAHAGPQAVGGAAQDLVPGLVPVHVVDPLEAVQVDQ